MLAFVSISVWSLLVLGNAVVINPKLENVASDKKFFGPPFPADYPSDERPTVSPDIAWQLKEENKPYPYLQNRKEYDEDYVKDENSDKGDWKAQFDYDEYRRKLADEEEAVRRAKEKADKEGKDASDAEKDLSDADKNANDAQKGLDDANKNADGSDKDGGAGGDGLSDEEKEKLKNLRKKVKDALDNLEKEKKEFEECKKNLEKAKKELDEAKAAHDEYEQHLQSQSKLWIIKSEADKQARDKARQAKKEANAARIKADEQKLEAAIALKKTREATLAKEKAEHVLAQKKLDQQKAKVAQAKAKLDDAKVRLQKLRGYKAEMPSKSSAIATFRVGSVLLLLASVSACAF
jgi:DNA repair exonuclease SbcCD ATPase subunit